jgi:hypothetical protein
LKKCVDVFDAVLVEVEISKHARGVQRMVSTSTSTAAS